MASGLKKNIFTLLLLAFCGSIIYGLPYFRKYFYDDYILLYNLNNFEMGLLGSAYGILGLFSYAIGGFLADKFAPRKLLSLSLFLTGLLGLLHLYFTDLTSLLIIYGIWGVTSLLTFWPLLMKVIRTLAAENEQARAYGVFEGGRGIVSAVHLAIATGIFGYFQSQALNGVGIEMVIVFYSVCPMLCAILLFFMLKDTPKQEDEKIHFKEMLLLLKKPVIWLVVAITFCTYFFQMSFYYFTPYATNILGASAVFAAILTVLAQYVRPLASVAGGFVADKYGKAPIMLVSFICMAVAVFLLMIVVDLSGGLQTAILLIACAIVYIASMLMERFIIHCSVRVEFLCIMQV